MAAWMNGLLNSPASALACRQYGWCPFFSRDNSCGRMEWWTKSYLILTAALQIWDTYTENSCSSFYRTVLVVAPHAASIIVFVKQGRKLWQDWEEGRLQKQIRIGEMCFMFPSNVTQLTSEKRRSSFIWFSFKSIIILWKNCFDHQAPSKIKILVIPFKVSHLFAPL